MMQDKILKWLEKEKKKTGFRVIIVRYVKHGSIFVRTCLRFYTRVWAPLLRNRLWTFHSFPPFEYIHAKYREFTFNFNITFLTQNFPELEKWSHLEWLLSCSFMCPCQVKATTHTIGEGKKVLSFPPLTLISVE